MKTGIQLIAKERKRQIEEEGWTAEHDDKHTDDELAKAAAVYSLPTHIRKIKVPVMINANAQLSFILWPYDRTWFKPTPDDRIRELEKAGALIAAEIDRLQRQKQN